MVPSAETTVQEGRSSGTAGMCAVSDEDFGSGVESGLGDEVLEVDSMPSPKSLFQEHNRFAAWRPKVSK